MLSSSEMFFNRGTKQLGGRDAKPKEKTSRQAARYKHRLSEMVESTLLPNLLEALEETGFCVSKRLTDLR